MTDRPGPGLIQPGTEERLARLIEDNELRGVVIDLINTGPDPGGAWDRLFPIIEADPDLVLTRPALDRACILAGASRALSRIVAGDPRLLQGDPDGEYPAIEVYAALATIAADDLRGELDLAEATALYSDRIDRVVARALAGCRAELTARHPIVSDLPFAVVAMGKWGARELNYWSDIDLVFVHDGLPGETEACRSAALALATRLMTVLSTPSGNGPRLMVDADLRPEGRASPLSRSIEGYDRYYAQWGAAWELQALLKARPVAGDPGLGARFMDLVATVIWERGLDVEALRSIRKLKEQVEDGASFTDIKRSRGGIRDVEFSVQLLQLVHGRLDPDLRRPATLDALAALHESGFVGDEDRDRLANAYAFLRNLEHRIQLWDLHQTQELPGEPERLAQLGRSMGLGGDAAAQLLDRLAAVRGLVRDVHERLYFRPILDALVGSPSARLGVEHAAVRLEALGFQDVNAARRALEELTTGLSRRSRAMQQVLPLMLDWLSLSPNPDLGLSQLRVVLANTPDHAALISLLQTNPLAGERLCRLLGTSRLIGDLIDRLPEFIPRLADDRLLSQIRERDAEIERLLGLLDSRPDPDARVGTVRRFSRRRKLRIAARDILGEASTPATLRSLTDSADAAVTGALHIASEGDPTGFSIVAMGKWGGEELSYGSDLDLIYVFSDETHRDRATQLAGEVRRVLSDPSRHGEAYSLDAGLRPEGKAGPLARSVDSYERYYDEWAEPWEMMALVKARPVCGDPALGARFEEVVAKRLWQPLVSPEFLRSIRLIKARVEKERIPTGEDPDYHLKLGRGSISDVEFLTQLLQLEHGGKMASLRVPGTLAGIAALAEAGLLSTQERAALEEAYLFCTTVRLRLHLQAGRAVDALPTNPVDLRSLAGSLGYDRSSELRDEYRRVTRRARRVFEKRFYGPG